MSVADPEDGRLLALQRDTNLKSTTMLVALICHFFEIWPSPREKVKKTVLFEPNLDHTHSFTNGKVSLHNTLIV